MARLLKIARKPEAHSSMEEVAAAEIDVETGLEGDWRGTLKQRQITVLERESWDAACDDLGQAPPWTLRRANLLVEGVPLKESAGQRLRVGSVLLVITDECGPCSRMDAQLDGLTAVLKLDWRGGVTCQVIESGAIAVGDSVELLDGI